MTQVEKEKLFAELDGLSEHEIEARLRSASTGWRSVRSSSLVSNRKHWRARKLRKPRTRQDVKDLRQLARENTPTRVIGIKLGRSEDSIYGKAQREDISLKPTNHRDRTKGRRLRPAPLLL